MLSLSHPLAMMISDDVASLRHFPIPGDGNLHNKC